MSWKPPMREGITPTERADDVALCCDDRLRMARSLKEMTDEWQFFSIGCMYTYGGLDCNIIAEFTQTHPDPDCTVITFQASRPLFIGICPPGWPDKERKLERELCAVPLEFWNALRNWVGQASMVDRKRGRFAQATTQDLDIVDYLAVNHTIIAPVKPPTLSITSFGVDGTHYHVGLMPNTDGPYAMARVVRLPIREETRRLGQAILAHDPRPFASIEPKPDDPADPADVARKIREAEEKSE